MFQALSNHLDIFFSLGINFLVVVSLVSRLNPTVCQGSVGQFLCEGTALKNGDDKHCISLVPFLSAVLLHQFYHLQRTNTENKNCLLIDTINYP